MSLDTERSAGDGLPPSTGQASSPQPPVARVKERRRPVLFAVMALLVAGGALTAVFAYTSASDTHEVLVVTRDVSRGEVIEADDLQKVRLSVDPALTPVTADERASIEGKRAQVDLQGGTLLTADAVTETVIPADGDSLVGIRLTPGQMPSEPIYTGDVVRITATPGEQGEVPKRTPDAIQATVVAVDRLQETGETVVNVLVPHGKATDLTAIAGTGRVALVVDSRER